MGFDGEWLDFWEDLKRKPSIFSSISLDFPVIVSLNQSLEDGENDSEHVAFMKPGCVFFWGRGLEASRNGGMIEHGYRNSGVSH